MLWSFQGMLQAIWQRRKVPPGSVYCKLEYFKPRSSPGMRVASSSLRLRALGTSALIRKGCWAGQLGRLDLWNAPYRDNFLTPNIWSQKMSVMMFLPPASLFFLHQFHLNSRNKSWHLISLSIETVLSWRWSLGFVLNNMETSQGRLLLFVAPLFPWYFGSSNWPWEACWEREV